MGNIQDLLAQILSARYGRDVRQSIHDAIETCYEDGHAGAIDLQAREDIAQEVTDREDADVLINGRIDTANGAIDGLSDRIDAIEDELSASNTGTVTETIWTSSYYSNLAKNGNVVSIVVGGTTDSPVSVTAETTLCRIPEGFRPKVTTSIFLEFHSSTGGEVKMGAALIAPDGKVTRQMVAGVTEQMQIIRLYGAWGV